MPQPIHQKIINRVAKSILGKNDIKRKGQSRIWLDDQYWYTTIIEFQPSKGQQGTYLNVGANLHWYLSDYLSFDIGNRESGLIQFKSEEQFEKEMQNLVHLALTKAQEIRSRLTDISTAEKTIMNYLFSSNDLWGNYHRGVIYGLNGKIKMAEKYFESVAAHDGAYEWITDLKQKSDKLKDVVKDTFEFRREMEEVIAKTRTEKKLAPQEPSFLW